jgi:cytochrome c biogenesis protein CcdA
VFLIILGLNLIGVIRIPTLYRTYALSAGAQPATVTVGGGGAGAGGVALGGGPPPLLHGVAYAKSLGVGAAFAVGWTPCIGPVLGTIITLSASSADVAQGAYLLLVYSLGLGVPFIITGLAVVPITAWLRRYRHVLPLVEVTMGVMIIVVGVLIFTDNLTIFNSWFSEIPFLEELNQI